MAESTETDTTLQLYTLSTNSLHTPWGLLSVIALALVGYAWRAKDGLQPPGKPLLGGILLRFAVVNHRAIAKAQQLLLDSADPPCRAS